jgi:hypothetical protein
MLVYLRTFVFHTNRNRELAGDEEGWKISELGGPENKNASAVSNDNKG